VALSMPYILTGSIIVFGVAAVIMEKITGLGGKNQSCPYPKGGLV